MIDSMKISLLNLWYNVAATEYVLLRKKSSAFVKLPYDIYPYVTFLFVCTYIP